MMCDKTLLESICFGGGKKSRGVCVLSGVQVEPYHFFLQPNSSVPQATDMSVVNITKEIV